MELDTCPALRSGAMLNVVIRYVVYVCEILGHEMVRLLGHDLIASVIGVTVIDVTVIDVTVIGVMVSFVVMVKEPVCALAFSCESGRCRRLCRYLT